MDSGSVMAKSREMGERRKIQATNPQVQGMSENRTAVFISHANPEDNVFTIWLGAKLSALGYEVWADALSLKGGEDWQRKLEQALRHRSIKVLLVGSTQGVEKQGVRNEIAIASEVAQEIGDSAFVIPLKLTPFKLPFVIVQAQYVDFENSWAKGLSDLERVLTEYNVPREARDSASIWREVQLINAKTLLDKQEVLISNWLQIAKEPLAICRYRSLNGAKVSASLVGSSRVDLQACKLEYSIVSPK